jgi:glycosyltransferase involved in cell wall biosynthesis
MKVVHISFSDRTGGAAIAAYRHNEAMSLAGISSKMIIVHSRNFQGGIVERVHKNEYYVRLRMFLQQMISQRIVDKASPSSQFTYAPVGFDVSQNKSVQQADAIFIHWINAGILSIQGIEKILQLGKPTYWYMHDMWPMTGGCHYALDCDKYMSQCMRCPILGTNGPKDLSYKQFSQKMSSWLPYDNLHVVTPSVWLSQCAASSALFSTKKNYVVPNVIDTDKFKPTDKIDARSRLNLPQDKKLLLFGAMDVNSPFKGWSLLEQAVNSLDMKDVECVVFGKCDTRQLSASLHKKTHFMGTLQDEESLALLYNAVDVVLLPSLAENYPNVILEGMATGTPAVAFNVGGVSDLVKHQVTGYLSNYKDVEDFTAGIKWVLESSDYAQLSAACQLSVKENNAYSKVLQIHYELQELK